MFNVSNRNNNLILTENQWKNILKWIPNNEKEQQEDLFLNYLKEASDSMKSKWPENNKNKYDQKLDEMKVLSPEMQKFEKIKNASPEERQRMIEEAEKFVSIRKIKECPIELRSAAILSENLHANKIQLEFQTELKKDEKRKTEIKNKRDIAQSVAWLNDGWEHRTNAHLIAKEHKKELLQMVTERNARKVAERDARIKEELEVIEKQLQEVKDAKTAAITKKKEMNKYMQEHSKQTSLMAKQKRERVKDEGEVIDVLMKVHNEGRNNINEMIKEQQIESKIDRMKLEMKLQKMAFDRHIKECKNLENEQKLIVEARKEKEIVLDERKLKDKKRKDKLKMARLEDYSQSLKQAKMRKALKKEEDKFYFQTRVTNDVISKEYAVMKKKMAEKNTKKNLDDLKVQAKLKRDHTIVEKEKAKNAFNKAYDEDKSDEKFFAYAKDLIEEALKKNRPVKPIDEALKVYKTRQGINAKQKTRPHEISNVPIEMEIQRIETNFGKSKRMLKYEEDEKKMVNVYRGTKFLTS
ncbi:DNA ligase 1-like [Chironomus tepperi]|uniref:DNA ligase 1-like n=1 Tax=Chironomus tepperi TaxID=113505 RepID=UPI00391F3577